MNQKPEVSGSRGELETRIAALVELYGSRKIAADAAGVSAEQLARYIRGENQAPFPVLAKLAAGKGISLDWLATGRGEMESVAAESERFVRRVGDAVVLRSIERGGVKPVAEGFVLVPRYDVRVSAGPGAIVGDENVRDWLAFRADFLRRELGAEPANVFSFDAVGDSMEPTIKHGDTLTFVRIAGALPSDGIFALGIGDALVVKRVQPVMGGLMLLSDNPAYKPETLSIEEAKEVRALGRLKVISRVV